jgi:transcriptional regulator with XRE-family HTH domain
MNDNHLRRKRLQRKISLMGLAQQAGTSPAWLTYIERYGHLPGPELRQRIARALEATEDEIWPELATAPDESGDTPGVTSSW